MGQRRHRSELEPRVLRRLYDWTLARAASPQAENWLMGISFADSSFFPIPPDVMQIPMSIARPEKSFRFAGLSTIASVCGALLGYAIGALLFEAIGVPLLQFYGYEDRFARFAASINEHGFWWMLAFAFLPIPYKVATIAAGSVGLGLPILIGASILGRGGRFFLVALLLKKYGAAAQELIDRYFHSLALAATVLFVGGFVVVKYAF
jgi:membrane protein YqaA with SNARE-associated domain